MIIKRFLFYLFSLLFLSCFGCRNNGFYLLESSVDLQQEEQTGDLNTKHFPYLTSRIYLRGEREIFMKDIFKNKRNTKLSHLYICASYKHPIYQVEKSIPLFMVDLDNPKYNINEGDLIISKIPILSDHREYGALKIESIALEKSKIDIISEYYEKGQKILQDQNLYPILGVAGAGAALDVISSVLKDVAGSNSKKYTSAITLQTPTFFPNGSLHQVQMYFILPTQNDGIIIPEAINEIKSKHFLIKRDNITNEPFAYIGEQKYTSLPYILIDYSLSDYVQELNLFPQVFSEDCSEINENSLKRVNEAIESPQTILSPQQKARELDLLRYAKGLCELRTAINLWSEKKDAKSIALVIDNYYKFSTLSFNSDEELCKKYYASRIKTISDCVAKIMLNVSSYSIISELSKRVKEVNDFIPNVYHASREELEENLRKLKPFLISNRIPLGEFADDPNSIKRTILFERALSNSNYIESEIFDRFFNSDIKTLNALNQRSIDGDSLCKKLTKRMNLPQITKCEICILEGIKAIDRYSALTRDENTKAIATIVADAATIGSKLSALDEVQTVLGKQPSKMDSVLSQRVSNLLEGQNNKPALNELKEVIRASNTILRAED